MLKPLATALAGLLLAAAADPPAPDRLARLFGAREGVSQISLSPAGDRVAVVAPTTGQGGRLLVVDLTRDGAREILRASGAPERLSSCQWLTAQRILCRLFVIAGKGRGALGFTRMVAINADGTDRKLLTAPMSSDTVRPVQQGGDVIDRLAVADDAVLMTRDFAPESGGDNISDNRDGLGVERVDLPTMKRRTVESANKGAVEYISDNRGQVRIRGTRRLLASGYPSSVIEYQYRTAGDRDWKTLGRLDGDAGTGFNPYAIDGERDLVYGFEKTDGRLALHSVALDGSLAKRLVFARPDVDVDGLVRIGRAGRVVGASFATDRRQKHFFDPELTRLANALSRAIPKLPLIHFIDADETERRLLIWAGSDVDPGRYYIFDKQTKRLDELLATREALRDVPLAAVKAITYPAADGTPIPAYLTLPPGGPVTGLPAIVLPHGGPGARDEWGFDWLAQFFAASGYAVLQPNFRGSAGYGDAWFQRNGFRSWRTAIGDVTDGGRWLAKQGIAAPGKLAVFGWSYGGYAALQSAVLDPALFKAVVAVAPVTDLDVLREEHRQFREFRVVDAFIGRGPHIREGSPARHAEAIAAPVLLFHGALDLNVGVGESRLMHKRLKEAGKRVEYVEFAGLDHYLEDEAARVRMLTKAEAFLKANLTP